MHQPWYARAVARFLVEQHKQNATSNEPLLIYELGAGNGTLMRGVMDYLSLFEPEVYASTTYHIIEISNRLSELQRAKAGENHAGKVEVINQDVFAYNRAPETRRCFVLAFEVLDNLAHDLVRFTLDPQTDPVPLQASVSISSTGEFVELYEPVQDALIADFLRLREGLDLPPLHASWPSWMRQLRAAVPFSANLSRPYYIPTKLLKLLRGLNTSFPHHRLLLSDFSSLPDAIPGWNAPVVQTRYKGQTVACTTYLVSQGFFDIFFPTDFKLLQHLYGAVRRTWTSESGVEQQAELEVCSHGAFLERWGETSETRLRNGENPMLDHYQNAAFAYTR